MRLSKLWKIISDLHSYKNKGVIANSKNVVQDHLFSKAIRTTPISQAKNCSRQQNLKRAKISKTLENSNMVSKEK